MDRERIRGRQPLRATKPPLQFEEQEINTAKDVEVQDGSDSDEIEIIPEPVVDNRGRRLARRHQKEPVVVKKSLEDKLLEDSGIDPTNMTDEEKREMLAVLQMSKEQQEIDDNFRQMRKEETSYKNSVSEQETHPESPQNVQHTGEESASPCHQEQKCENTEKKDGSADDDGDDDETQELKFSQDLFGTPSQNAEDLLKQERKVEDAKQNQEEDDDETQLLGTPEDDDATQDYDVTILQDEKEKESTSFPQKRKSEEQVEFPIKIAKQDLEPEDLRSQSPVFVAHLNQSQGSRTDSQESNIDKHTPTRTLINKRKHRRSRIHGHSYFSPTHIDPDVYTKTIISLFDQYRVLLREAQINLTKHVAWGEPVEVGRHQSRTIDFKKRGGSIYLDDLEKQTQLHVEEEVMKENQPVREDSRSSSNFPCSQRAYVLKTKQNNSKSATENNFGFDQLEDDDDFQTQKPKTRSFQNFKPVIIKAIPVFNTKENTKETKLKSVLNSGYKIPRKTHNLQEVLDIVIDDNSNELPDIESNNDTVKDKSSAVANNEVSKETSINENQNTKDVPVITKDTQNLKDDRKKIVQSRSKRQTTPKEKSETVPVKPASSKTRTGKRKLHNVDQDFVLPTEDKENYDDYFEDNSAICNIKTSTQKADPNQSASKSPLFSDDSKEDFSLGVSGNLSKAFPGAFESFSEKSDKEIKQDHKSDSDEDVKFEKEVTPVKKETIKTKSYKICVVRSMQKQFDTKTASEDLRKSQLDDSTVRLSQQVDINKTHGSDKMPNSQSPGALGSQIKVHETDERQGKRRRIKEPEITSDEDDEEETSEEKPQSGIITKGKQLIGQVVGKVMNYASAVTHNVPKPKEEPEDQIQCPMCSSYFGTSAIEEHAADCNGIPSQPEPPKRTTRRQQQPQEEDIFEQQQMHVRQPVADYSRRRRTSPRIPSKNEDIDIEDSDDEPAWEPNRDDKQQIREDLVLDEPSDEDENSGPSTRISPRGQKQQKRTKKAETEPREATIPCLVCQKQVQESNYEEHVNLCLDKQATQGEDPDVGGQGDRVMEQDEPTILPRGAKSRKMAQKEVNNNGDDGKGVDIDEENGNNHEEDDENRPFSDGSGYSDSDDSDDEELSSDFDENVPLNHGIQGVKHPTNTQQCSGASEIDISQIGNSPIKTFRAISKQTDSLIDYKNQFRQNQNRKRKRSTNTANPSRKRRKYKRKGKRKKKATSAAGGARGRGGNRGRGQGRGHSAAQNKMTKWLKTN